MLLCTPRLRFASEMLTGTRHFNSIRFVVNGIHARANGSKDSIGAFDPFARLGNEGLSDDPSNDATRFSGQRIQTRWNITPRLFLGTRTEYLIAREVFERAGYVDSFFTTAWLSFRF